MKIIVSRAIRITLFLCTSLTVHTTHTMEQQLSVIHNIGINEGEHAFLKNRLPIAKIALEKILNRKLNDNQVPKIALVGSGGGYRAMFCTAGSLCAAQKMGLLDATTYLTALSGSTWCVAPWISTGKPIDEFKPYLQSCAAKSFGDLSLEEKILMVKALAKKNAYKQALTLVDPYGGLLANRLLEALGDKRQKTKLSEQAQKVASGAYPYPIYVAIDGRESIITGQTWYEFTPHTIGDRTNNMHIPTEIYGKKLKKGTIVKDAPEKSLADLMGTWGSAFGANVHEIILEIIKDSEILKTIFELLPDFIEADRLLPFYAKVANYMRDMNDIQDTTLTPEKYMFFVDAGLEINLPYPPISGICPERKADIIILLDASAGQIGDELIKISDYAQTHNLPFPSIDFNNIDKKTISIFKDEKDSSKPIVIYMPRISDKALWETYKLNPEFAQYNLSGFDLDYETNEGFCETQHFQYTPENSALVMNQTEFNMLVNKNIIIEAINSWIDRT